MSDRLALSNAFEEAGIERRHAEHISGVVFEVIRGNVATKADLDALGAGMKADLAALTADIASLADGTKAGIAALAVSSKADVASLTASSTSDLDIVVRDMKIWTGRLLVGLLSLQLVGIGLLIRYLPHG
jgi:hypothetical protein